MTNYVPVKEAAKKLDRHYTQVYTAIRNGRLKGKSIDGRMTVDMRQAERLFNRIKQKSAYTIPTEQEQRATMAAVRVLVHNEQRAEAEQAAQEQAKAEAVAAMPPALNNLPVVSELRQLDEFLSGRFGKYAPPLDKVVREAVALVMADIEGRVTVREAA